MARALNDRKPSDTALNRTVLSAHRVRLYELFSMLHPVKILPEEVRSAAPTRNFEYGAYALDLEDTAFSTREAYVLLLYA
jgi:hypothetical protein